MRIGCSGWQYRSWRGVLYPEGMGQPRWLARYAEVFDTVEVNSTFYRLASRDAVARWVEQTPAGFCLAAEISRGERPTKHLVRDQPAPRQPLHHTGVGERHGFRTDQFAEQQGRLA